MLLLTHVQCNRFLIREARQHKNFFPNDLNVFWSDPQPGTEDQRSNQVVTDGVANADDMNPPGEDSCSFLQKNPLCKN